MTIENILAFYLSTYVPGADSQTAAIRCILDSCELLPQLELHLPHLLVGQVVVGDQPARARGQQEDGQPGMGLHQAPGPTRTRQQGGQRAGTAADIAAVAVVTAHREVD